MSLFDLSALIEWILFGHNPVWLILTPTMNNKKYCLVKVFPNGRSHNHTTNTKSLSSHHNHHYHLLQSCHHPNRQHHNHHQHFSFCFQGTILKGQTMFKLFAIANQTVFWTALTMPSIFSCKMWRFHNQLKKKKHPFLCDSNSCQSKYHFIIKLGH